MKHDLIIGSTLNCEIETKEQWLQDRKGGITATDIATIVGANPFKTAYKLWREKTGLDEPDSLNSNMARGLFLEQGVAQMFGFESKNSIFNTARDLYICPENDKHRCSPDYFYHNPDKGTGVLEIKTNASYIKDSKDAHYIQLQWNMYVTQCDFGTIAYLDSSLRLKHFEYELDSILVEQLKEYANEFWQFIETKQEPALLSISDIEDKYSEATEESIEADESIISDYINLVKYRSEIKEFEIKLKECEERIKLFMLDKSQLTNSGEVIATWKSQAGRKTYDMQAIGKEIDLEKHTKVGKNFRVFKVK
jgi:putative phage-type endonuclease